MRFFQQMAALRWLEEAAKDGERKEKKKNKAPKFVASPNSLLVFMTFAFYLPLTTAWGLKRGKHCFYLSHDTGLMPALLSLLAQVFAVVMLR